MRHLGRILTQLILGAIGGAACDQIHVRFGVLWYPRPEPGLFGQPWWVPVIFGAATALILATAQPFARKAAPKTPEVLLSPYATGAIWFLGAYFLSGLLYKKPLILAAIYGAAFVVRMIPRPDRVPVIAYALLLAAGGCAFEGVLSSTGAFHYTQEDQLLFGYVPVWLAGLYLHGAPLAIAIAQGLDLRRAAG
jgi:hypothetical protein